MAVTLKFTLFGGVDFEVRQILSTLRKNVLHSRKHFTVQTMHFVCIVSELHVTVNYIK
jgi:hypothetical protein